MIPRSIPALKKAALAIAIAGPILAAVERASAELLAGPPASPPQLPLEIVKGKDQGATAGFQVVDAAGKKFMKGPLS